MSRKSYNKAILFVLIPVGVMFACGSSFPNSYLVNNDELLLSAPRLNFYNEINRIPLEQETTFQAVHRPAHIHNSRDHVLLIDIQDLQKALEERGDSSDDVKMLVEEYRTMRLAIEQYRNERKNYYRSPSKGGHEGSEPIAIFSVDQISEQLPQEFRLYLQGVMFYRTSKTDKAVKAWQQLLALSQDQRRYRSTWAAYMLSKTLRRTKDNMRHWCQRVRQLAHDGYHDSLGLAAVSYGDEAATYLAEDQYEKAIQLYLVQVQTRDPTAVPSLKGVCCSIFNRHKSVDLVDLVKSRMTRQVLLAYALTCPKNEKYNAFISKEDDKARFTTSQQLLLDAIEQAKLDSVENADRLAAIAYRDGHFERAKRWLNLSDGAMDSPLARRIRAKLLLRDGKIFEASEELAYIARQVNPGRLRYHRDHSGLDNSHKLHSELGTLYVSQKMYVQAVDVLMKGGNWIDTAYIAERVLTREELQDYVDAQWPESMLEPINDEDGFGPEGLKAQTIRYLLARRLSRHGQFEKARPYYPTTQKELLEDFDTFTKALERANDDAFSQSERADAFWTAAWLMRHKGMEFMGTELSPDWTMFRGKFELTDPLEYRKKYSVPKGNNDTNFESVDTGVFEVASKPNIDNHQLNRPSPDEIERAGREVAIPNKRFHYRYFASDLAWEAAALMQNEDEELARRLCLSGTWHRDLDNKHADKFYKALVIRCGSTALGKEADKIRWFPKISDTLTAKETKGKNDNENTGA